MGKCQSALKKPKVDVCCIVLYSMCMDFTGSVQNHIEINNLCMEKVFPEEKLLVNPKEFSLFPLS